MSPGLMKKNHKLQNGKEDVVDSLPDAPVINATDEKYVGPANSLSALNAIKEEERQLLIEKKQLMETIDQVQLKCDTIADKKSRLMAEMEKDLSTKKQKSENESTLQLFQIETSGSSFDDGLVFTVLAEDHVWAEGLVREWIQCYGKDTDKIDKLRAVVSRDVRAIINVGTKLQTV